MPKGQGSRTEDPPAPERGVREDAPAPEKGARGNGDSPVPEKDRRGGGDSPAPEQGVRDGGDSSAPEQGARGGEDAPVPEIWTARRRLAAAMRLVIERLTASDAPEDELRRAATGLEEYAAHLAAHAKRDRYIGFSESALASPGEEPSAPRPPRAGGHFDYSPLIGRSNPLAPPVIMHADADGAVHGRVTFGSAYEGPPGCVHGGLVAAAFDEVLGYAQIFSGRPGMTGTLEVIYRSPTPLHQELHFTARVARRSGRKVFVHGQLHAGARLCAEATGLFIGLRPGAFDRLMQSRRPAPGQTGAEK